MTNKIFRSTILVAAVVLLCSLGSIMGVLYDYFNDLQVAQLKNELRLAALATEENGISFLKKVDSNRYRITWVDERGAVIYDTHADIETMEKSCGSERNQRGNCQWFRKRCAPIRYLTGAKSL